MFKYICKRVVFLFFVMFGVSLLTFGMVHLTPGDPAEILLRTEGINATPQAVEALREKLGLNNPLPVHALLPLVTAFGMSLGHLLGGTAIVETIFAWPGMGHYLVDSIFGRDYAVVQGYVLLMALIFVILNLLVDISYAFIDPRMRIAKKGEDQ